MSHGRAVLLSVVASVMVAVVPSASAATFNEYTLPNASSKGPLSITPGPDGNVWFAEYDWGFLGKITPAGNITEYDVRTGGGDFLQGIVTGPDNNIWFTRWQPNRIEKLDPGSATPTPG